MSERLQLLWLFVLAAPIACVAWTVTHEEVFSEFHEWCVGKSQRCKKLYQRKFFYLFTCEYCFSHYVAAATVLVTGYRLLLPTGKCSPGPSAGPPLPCLLASFPP